MPKPCIYNNFLIGIVTELSAYRYHLAMEFQFIIALFIRRNFKLKSGNILLKCYHIIDCTKFLFI